MRVKSLTPQDLKAYGINDVQDVVYNPDYETLYQEELRPDLEGYERGVLTTSGAVAVDTGIFTGRSPKDKYIVRDDTTRDTVWWSDKGKGKNDNKPLSPQVWQHLKGLVTEQLSGKRLFIVDAFCGANPDTRLAVRFITEVAWQAHFVKNMFIRPSDEELAEFTPDFIVMNGAKCTNPQWKEQGLNSENFVAFNLTERIQLIGGTWYGGEMKKGMFSIMNYLLPLQGIASMHCSANVGEKGDVAVFFGLSGTGTTTASSTLKAAATRKPFVSLKRRSPIFSMLFAAMRCWKTSACAPMAASTLTMRRKPRTPVSPTRFTISRILLNRSRKQVTPPK